MKMIGQLGPLPAQPLLQLEAVQVRKRDIEHEATRGRHMPLVEKGLRRGEGLHGPTGALDEGGRDSRTETSSSMRNTMASVRDMANLEEVSVACAS